MTTVNLSHEWYDNSKLVTHIISCIYFFLLLILTIFFKFIASNHSTHTSFVTKIVHICQFVHLCCSVREQWNDIRVIWNCTRDVKSHISVLRKIEVVVMVSTEVAAVWVVTLSFVGWCDHRGRVCYPVLYWTAYILTCLYHFKL